MDSVLPRGCLKRMGRIDTQSAKHLVVVLRKVAEIKLESLTIVILLAKYSVCSKVTAYLKSQEFCEP